VKRSIARIAVLVIVLHSTQTLLCDMICAPAIATEGAESGHCSQHTTASRELSASESRCDHASEIASFTALATSKLTKGARCELDIRFTTLAAVLDTSQAARSNSPPGRPPHLTTSRLQVLRV
jgi:hypothetical protein